MNYALVFILRRSVLRNDNRYNRQLLLIVIAVTGAHHHTAADHGQQRIFRFAGQHQIEFIAMLAIQTGKFGVIPEGFYRQGLIGGDNQLGERFADAGDGVVPVSSGNGAQMFQSVVGSGLSGIDFQGRIAAAQ